MCRRNLRAFGSWGLAEDDRGLLTTEADNRQPDFYARFDPFQLDIAQYLAPEPSQQFGVAGVQHQFGYPT